MIIRDKRVKTGLLSFLSANMSRYVIVSYELNGKEYIKPLNRVNAKINTFNTELELVFCEGFPVDMSEYELVYPNVKAYTVTEDKDYIYLDLKLYKRKKEK